MKRKLCWLALLCLLNGGILMLAGWMFGGAPQEDWGPADSMEESESWSSMKLDAFEAAEIHLSWGDLSVRPGDDWELRWTGSQGDVRVEDGVLHLEDDRWDGSIVLLLPDEAPELAWLDVSSDMGGVELYGVRAGTLSVASDMGFARLSDVSAGTLDAVLSMGGLDLTRVTADAVTAELDAGSVTLWDCVLGQTSFTLGMGSLQGSGVTLNGLTAELDMGELDLEGTLTGRLDVTASMGGIRLATSLPLDQYSGTARAGMGGVYLEREDQGGSLSLLGDGANTLNLNAAMGEIDLMFE